MSKRVPSTMVLALAAALAGAQGTASSWLNDNLVKRIFISGRREIGLHMHKVSGDRQAFKDLTYSGRGGKRFTDTGQVNIDGRNVFGVLNFQIQVADDRYSDPENRRLSVDYKKGPYSVNAGDIRGSMLNTNQFASFNRSLKGVSAGYQNGRFAFRGVTSKAKGSATTISVQGDNSVGPYYLQNSRIAKDSVRVMVDGQELALGTDYVVNYDIGSITFQNKIIAPTSTIVVTYESISFNASQGSVRGLGASYDFGKFGKVGVTSLAQDPSGVQGLNQRTDLFQGFGDPSTPYTLTYEPLLTRPVLVKLQGIIQTEGVHYRFDLNNPAVFYFLFPVPSTSDVDVTYTPKPINTVDGERRVVGFDYTLPFGDKTSRGSVVYNQATGTLRSEVTPMSGTARSVAVNYARGSLQLRSSYRDVPNTFVGIQSTGFLRNEKSVDFSVTNKSGLLNYGVDLNNSLIGTRNSTSTGALIFRNARTTSARAFLNLAQAANTNWSLQQIRTTSRPAGAQETKLDTTSLGNSTKIGKLNTSVTYSQTSGVAPLTEGSTNVMSDVALNTLRFSGVYNAGSAWTIGTTLGLSDVKAGEKSGHGNDISMNAEYKPSEKLAVQFQSSQSSSGAVANLAGFQSGFGLGYGGNGFSSGVPGIGTLGSDGNNYRSNSLGVIYQITPKMNVATRFSTGSASGTIASNSKHRSLSLDLDWDLGRGHVTGLSVANSHTDFLSTDAVSNATTLDWYIVGTPQAPWSYRFGANYLLSGGNNQFGQDSLSLDASLLRKIGEKQRLGFAYHMGRTTGYLPQDENYFQLFHEYQLYQNIALRTSYSWRDVRNNDPLIAAGAYTASGLDINLTFDFVP
jgi:hypothetical protein